MVKNVNQGILFDLSQNSHFQNHEECMADSAEKWYLDPGRKKGLKDQADWIFSIAYCALNVGEFYLLPFYITHFFKMQLLCSLFSHFPWSICVLRPSTLTCRSWIGTTIFCTSFSASRNLFSKKIWPIFQLRKAAFAGKTLNMLSVFLYSYNSI